MKDLIFETLSAALFAGLLQNILFAGGFGMTEAIRMAAKPNNLARTAGLVTAFSVSVTLVCRLLDRSPLIASAGKLAHSAVFSGVLAGVYLVSLAVAAVLRCSELTKRRLGVCALNTLILSLPYVSYKSAFTIPQALGTAIGAAGAYVIAVLLLKLGIEKISAEPSVPEAFRGNGALFIYAALLSLAFAGITGARIAL